MDKDRITLPRLAVPSQSPSTSHPPPPPPYQPLEPSLIDQPPPSTQQPQPIQRHSLPSLTSTTSRPLQPPSSSISKPKKLHREVEQKRRMRMAEQIQELRQCVSDPTRGKTDKVSVLQDAVAYVKRASARINQLTEALDRSQAECAHLRSLLAASPQHHHHQRQQQQQQQQPSPQLSQPPPPLTTNPATPSVSQSWPSQSIDPFLSRSNFPVTRQQWEPLPRPTPTAPHPIPTQLPHHFPSPSSLHHRKSSLDIRPNPEIPQSSNPVYQPIPVSSDFDRPQLPRPPPREDDDFTYKSDPSPDPSR